MKIRDNHAGFGVIGIVTIVVVIAIIGFGGWAVASKHKTNTQTNTSASSAKKSNISSKKTSSATTALAVTADELTALAKQVYYQVPAEDANNPMSVGACAGQTLDSCPFTTNLKSKIIPQTPAHEYVGNVLVAGVQQGPYGTVSYANATPTNNGGTVTVNLNANTSAAGNSLSWKLTMVQSDGKLLINDIQYTRLASSTKSACGAIEIYNYMTCLQQQ